MLGLGLGMGVGNKAPLLPVSAFPSVADIPPGMVVLDSDGVVKECDWVFRNAGLDYINMGRPDNLISLLHPSKPYRMRVVCNPVNIAASQVILSIGGTVVAEMQLQIAIVGGYVEAVVGGVLASRVNATSFAGKMFSIDLIKSATDAQLVLNGTVFGTKLNTGSVTYAGSLYINGRWDAATNFEGNTVCLNFYDSNDSFIDAFDPNQDALWDGGLTGTTVMGSPFTVTNASPLDIRVKALVPVGLRCQ